MKGETIEEWLFPGWESWYDGLDLCGRIYGWWEMPLNVMLMYLQSVGKFGHINRGGCGWQGVTAPSAGNVIVMGELGVNGVVSRMFLEQELLNGVKPVGPLTAHLGLW